MCLGEQETRRCRIHESFEHAYEDDPTDSGRTPCSDIFTSYEYDEEMPDRQEKEARLVGLFNARFT